MTACDFCGRENVPSSRFCFDCGKPVSASAAASVASEGATSPGAGQRTSPDTAGGGVAQRASAPPAPSALVPPTRVGRSAARCPTCAKPVDPSLPFCAHCGARVADAATGAGAASCPGCGAGYAAGSDLFCARCGQRVGAEPGGPSAPATGAVRRDAGPRVVLLDDNGDVAASYALDRGEAVIGRGDADIRLDDVFLSPVHARLELRRGELWVRDLGSRNGTWIFIEQPTRLVDGDVVIVGSQLLRFRRLGYPGPRPPESDATRRMGSLTPSADVAVLEQLRADGSVRDSFHLSPGRTVLMGRESGDWLFPYDQTMSGRHAEIRSEDADFFVHDAGSRNGVALAVRSERTVRAGQRLLLGDQVLRIESISQ